MNWMAHRLIITNFFTYLTGLAFSSFHSLISSDFQVATSFLPVAMSSIGPYKDALKSSLGSAFLSYAA